MDMMFPATVYDVPSQTPRVAVPLNRVTVCNQKIEVPFADDLFGSVSALFDVRADVTLRRSQRGIHMSRIEQAFQDQKQGLPIWEVALGIARRIAEVQDQEGAVVSLSGDVIVRRDTNVTSLPSYNRVVVLAKAKAGATEEAGLGLEATIMTACPCMQAYALDDLVRTFGLSVENPADVIGKVPIATHSQKGTVTAMVSGASGDLRGVNLAMLYDIFGKATHMTSELLKRPDEYEMVRRVHRRPQFVEDVVRDVLSELSVKLEGQSSALSLRVKAASFESIHGHDIEAECELGLGE